ncbi:MAG TPA: GIDE domain-containing protein [Candidatus Eremiobacteraceae bacterium]|nr:GIDE domain-containing protein [Candidatus Eremiobacteraceae bacterium]
MTFSTFSLATLLLRSSDSRPIVWCVIGFFVGIYLFFQGFRLLQRRRLILDTPVSKVRSASLGMVELSGLAVGPYTMVAPISERSCYYYRTIAWEWKRSGKNNQWVKVAAESMHVPFFLDDNTGKVMVDPRGAELDLHRDFQQEFCDSFFTTKPEAPPNVFAFLARHGVSTTNKIKVEEFCIKPKNALFLLGTLDENPGLELTPQPIQDEEHNTLTFGGSLGVSFNSGGSGLGNALSFATGGSHSDDDTYETRSISESLMGGGRTLQKSVGPTNVIHLSPTPSPPQTGDMTQQQKVAAALLKAGISNPAAWAAAGVTPSPVLVHSDAHGDAHSDAHGEVQTEPNGSAQNTAPNSGAQVASQPEAQPDGFDPHPPVVLMKGKNNPTFLISWRSQRDLTNSLGWKCTLMIWGGPALVLLSLYGLHALTHWF